MKKVRKPRPFKDPGFYTPVAYVNDHTNNMIAPDGLWLGSNASDKFIVWLKKVVKYQRYRERIQNEERKKRYQT